MKLKAGRFPRSSNLHPALPSFTSASLGLPWGLIPLGPGWNTSPGRRPRSSYSRCPSWLLHVKEQRLRECPGNSCQPFVSTILSFQSLPKVHDSPVNRERRLSCFFTVVSVWRFAIQLKRCHDGNGDERKHDRQFCSSCCRRAGTSCGGKLLPLPC